jgi:SAM-dependent methyltransferase
MSGRERKSLKKGSSRDRPRKRPKHEKPQPARRPTADDHMGAERFIPEESGPLPGYEHAHRYLAASLIFEKGRILDLASGSGTGTATLRAAGAAGQNPSGSGLKVVGIDLDFASARRAAPAVQGDAVRLPFADASFDGVICFETIEHLEEPPRLLEEIRRVLRRGGVALLSTPNRDVFTTRAGRSNPFHVNEMNPEELRRVLGGSFPHVALYSQSVWAGSWLAELREDDAAPQKATTRRWHVVSKDLAPIDDATPAPWADREETHAPYALYLVAVCSSSAKAFDRVRRILGENHLLNDRAQWLLGHYLASLDGLVERDALTESHAVHGHNLEKRLDESREHMRSLEAHAENLEAERGPLLAQLASLTEHAANTKELESKARSRIASLEEHADNLATELARRDERASAAFAHAANLEVELEGRSTHAANLEVELEGRSTHAANLEVALEGRSIHADNLEAERSALKRRIDELERHVRDCGERNHAELERVAVLVEQAKSLSAERNIWCDRADAARLELDDLRASRTVRFVTWLRT